MHFCLFRPVNLPTEYLIENNFFYGKLLVYREYSLVIQIVLKRNYLNIFSTKFYTYISTCIHSCT